LRTNAHTVLIAETLILLGREAHDICRVWKNHTGVAYTIESVKEFMRTFNEKSLRPIKFGLPGAGDISGIHISGKSIWLEGKTGTGRQSAIQKSFQEMIHKFGGHYLEFRHPEEALRWVKSIEK
jgi:hypothetical protein